MFNPHFLCARVCPFADVKNIANVHKCTNTGDEKDRLICGSTNGSSGNKCNLPLLRNLYELTAGDIYQ